MDMVKHSYLCYLRPFSNGNPPPPPPKKKKKERKKKSLKVSDGSSCISFASNVSKTHVYTRFYTCSMIWYCVSEMFPYLYWADQELEGPPPVWVVQSLSGLPTRVKTSWPGRLHVLLCGVLLRQQGQSTGWHRRRHTALHFSPRQGKKKYSGVFVIPYICPYRGAVPNRHAGPSSNIHTTSVKGQIHTKCLIKHQKVIKK